MFLRTSFELISLRVIYTQGSNLLSATNTGGTFALPCPSTDRIRGRYIFRGKYFRSKYHVQLLQGKVIESSSIYVPSHASRLLPTRLRSSPPQSYASSPPTSKHTVSPIAHTPKALSSIPAFAHSAARSFGGSRMSSVVRIHALCVVGQ